MTYNWIFRIIQAEMFEFRLFHVQLYEKRHTNTDVFL